MKQINKPSENFPNYEFYHKGDWNQLKPKVREIVLQIQSQRQMKIDDVQQFYQNFEYDHSFIQWLFPNFYTSKYNPNSFKLTLEERKKMISSRLILKRLYKNYVLILRFFGIEVNYYDLDDIDDIKQVDQQKQTDENKNIVENKEQIISLKNKEQVEQSIDSKIVYNSPEKKSTNNESKQVDSEQKSNYSESKQISSDQRKRNGGNKDNKNSLQSIILESNKNKQNDNKRSKIITSYLEIKLNKSVIQQQQSSPVQQQKQNEQDNNEQYEISWLKLIDRIQFEKCCTKNVHNLLRLRRIIGCLSILKHRKEALQFCRFLENELTKLGKKHIYDEYLSGYEKYFDEMNENEKKKIPVEKRRFFNGYKSLFVENDLVEQIDISIIQ